jgi:cation-transporting P-type ATPase I
VSTSRFGRAVPVSRLLRSAAWVPLRTARLAATTTSALAVLTVETAASAVTAGTALATTPVRRATALVSSAQVGPSLARVAGELVGGEPSRRCWRADNRYWIEVCGLDDTAVGHRVAAAVLDAVRDQPGVAAAKLNRAISRVIVWVDADGPTLRELCAVIDTAENDARAGAGHSGRNDRTELPADDIVLARGVTTVAVNAAGLGTALVGRALRGPRLPAGLAAVVAVVDYQPRLRRLI